MKNHVIDNSATEEFGKTILWQYDKAANLMALIGNVADFYNAAVGKFWDAYPKDVIAIDSANKMGLTVWGRFIGTSRPMYYSSVTQTASYVSDEMYRRILKARFFLMKASGSSYDIARYMAMVFPAFGSTSLSSLTLRDLGNMAMTYEPNNSLGAVVPSFGDVVKAGQIIAVPMVYEVLDDIEKGAEWDSSSLPLTVVGQASQFNSDINYDEGSLVVYDGECFSRESDQTSPPLMVPPDEGDGFYSVHRVNNTFEKDSPPGDKVAHVEIYVSNEEFTWTGVESSLQHMTMLPVTAVTNEDTSPISSSPWDHATQEEKDVFTTFSSTDPTITSNVKYNPLRELFPFPAGVKDNTPVTEIVFGFAGQEPEEESPSDNHLGSVQVTTLAAKSSATELTVRAGSSTVDIPADPQVGSFVDSSVTGAWDSTVFIPLELQGEMEAET